MKRIVAVRRHMPGSAAIMAGPRGSARGILGEMDDATAGAASREVGHGNLLFLFGLEDGAPAQDEGDTDDDRNKAAVSAAGRVIRLGRLGPG